MTNKLTAEEFSRIQVGDYVYVRPLADMEEEGYIKNDYGFAIFFDEASPYYFDKDNMEELCEKKFKVVKVGDSFVDLENSKFRFTRFMLTNELEYPAATNSNSDWQDMILCGCNQ